MTSVGPELNDVASILVTRLTDELKPHPALRNRGLMPAPEELLSMEQLGDSIYERPILISHENLVIDGYPTWIIARRQKRASLLCLESRLTEQQALHRLITNDRRKQWLKPFNRVELALELEESFREEAQANRIDGGKWKDASKLTELSRCECRQRIASVAGISTGNVTKVKAILQSGNSTLIDEARRGRISIHFAWQLSKIKASEQDLALGSRRLRMLSRKRIRVLLSRDSAGTNSKALLLGSMMRALSDIRHGLNQCPVSVALDCLVDAIAEELKSVMGGNGGGQAQVEANTDRQSEHLGQYSQ